MHIQNQNILRYETPSDDSLNWSVSPADLKLLQKSRYQCSSCGLQSAHDESCPSGYLEVVRIGDQPKVLCVFCAQSLCIGRSVNGRNNHGLILYCPTLTQAHISQLATHLFISRYRDDENSEKARALINRIMVELVDPVADLIPDFESGTARELADILDSLSPRGAKNIAPILKNLCYWPYEDIFNKQIAFWSAHSPGHKHDQSK